jgi:hypothetical protein
MLLSCHIDTVSSLLTVRIVPSTGIVFGCEDGVAAAGDGSLRPSPANSHHASAKNRDMQTIPSRKGGRPPAVEHSPRALPRGSWAPACSRMPSVGKEVAVGEEGGRLRASSGAPSSHSAGKEVAVGEEGGSRRLEKEEGDALASAVAGSAPAPSAPDPPLALVLHWEGRPAGALLAHRAEGDTSCGRVASPSTMAAAARRTADPASWRADSVLPPPDLRRAPPHGVACWRACRPARQRVGARRGSAGAATAMERCSPCSGRRPWRHAEAAVAERVRAGAAKQEEERSVRDEGGGSW